MMRLKGEPSSESSSRGLTMCSCKTNTKAEHFSSSHKDMIYNQAFKSTYREIPKMLVICRDKIYLLSKEDKHSWVMLTRAQNAAASPRKVLWSMMGQEDEKNKKITEKEKSSMDREEFEPGSLSSTPFGLSRAPNLQCK